MSALRQFTIPFAGLKDGIHQYDFSIDDEFFSQFEETPIEKGSFDVKFILDKRADMLVLTFDIKGSFKTACDRCLANIDLPIENAEDLIVKYAEEADDSDEVIYIQREATELNIAKYIYESVCLSMPVSNVYDCEDEPENVCDLEMLSYLDNENKEEAKENDDETPNSPWDELKNFNNNN